MSRTSGIHKYKSKTRLAIIAVAATAGLAGGAVTVTSAMAGPGAKPAAETSPRAGASHQEDRPAPIAAAPKDDKRRGMVYDGLTPAPKGDKCVGMYKLSEGDLCSHGPDAAPKGVDIAKDAAPVVRNASAAAGSGSQAVCNGDGKQGNRVQVLYVHAAGQDRFAQYRASFKKWAADADVIYNESAKETGGSRHIRYVTDSDCTASVNNVEVPASALGDFDATNQAVTAKGYNRQDRKYVMFTDANLLCGIGTLTGDDRPGKDNRNNFGPSYSRVDSGCWNGHVAAHELGHNLGAVNDSAPNSSKHGHCTDEWDLMCYSDAPGVEMRNVCQDRNHEERLDCNHDDYFSTKPQPGSYLATHWNTANNLFLIPDATKDAGTGPTAKASRITAKSAVLTWQAVRSAKSYQVRLNGRSAGESTSTTLRVTGLRAGTSYQATVSVRDRNGRTSRPGPAVTFRTPASS